MHRPPSLKENHGFKCSGRRFTSRAHVGLALESATAQTLSHQHHCPRGKGNGATADAAAAESHMFVFVFRPLL